MTRVLTLLPMVGHPRDSKRIDMLLAEGLEVEVGAFQRPFPASRLPNCPVVELGRVENGHYLRRAVVALQCLPKVAALSRRNDIIYASGQDMALIGLLAAIGTGRPVVMEIGDLRAIQLARGVAGIIMRTLDRYIVNRVALTVTTSEKYVSDYYSPLLGRIPNHIVVENKLDASFAREMERRRTLDLHSQRQEGSALRLGYFGVLRFQWCIDALHYVVDRADGAVELILAGYSTPGVDLSRLLALPGVKYVPHYKSPQDLPGLYGQIDAMWGCYPASSGEPSATTGRTNRFYEAALFQKPLVVLAGSGDADAVEMHGIGPLIPEETIEAAWATVASITSADLRRWAAALAALPSSIYSYSYEQTELARRLREIAGMPRGGRTQQSASTHSSSVEGGRPRPAKTT